MKLKKILGCVTMAAMLLSTSALASNPEIREDGDGNLIYQGDPAAFIDDDGTVYLYVGHDTATGNGYSMPNWLCYSSTDMVNWKYEGVPLSAADFSWGSDNQAWASQVVKYNGKYYFYMCKSATGMSVGVSDSPTGPFKDAKNGVKLVDPGWTNGKVGWDDIDPTIWIENDENGVEHRYICWGNSNLYLAELDETMISLADRNGDGAVNGGDITELTVNGIPSDSQYTEAPWLYRRSGDSRYYIFFASNWREDLSYATSENIWGPYEYGGLVMRVGASSNTNHPSVIDYKGQTYFIYHTGALEKGSGYCRSVCIDRLVFDSEGNPAQLEESSIGLDGTAVKLLSDGEPLFHTHFENSNDDSAYPMGGTLRLGGSNRWETDSLWELTPGLIEGDNHVSIQSVNKMGYFVTEYDGYVKLLHDDDATTQSKTDRTFIMEEAAEGVSFESLSSPGKYLSVKDGLVVLSDEKAYFDIAEMAASALEAEAVSGGILVKGATQPDAELVVTVKKGSELTVGCAKADSEGIFRYAIECTDSGSYEISAAGKTVTVEFGGAE